MRELFHTLFVAGTVVKVDVFVSVGCMLDIKSNPSPPQNNLRYVVCLFVCLCFACLLVF